MLRMRPPIRFAPLRDLDKYPRKLMVSGLTENLLDGALDETMWNSRMLMTRSNYRSWAGAKLAIVQPGDGLENGPHLGANGVCGNKGQKNI